jgi:cell division protein FtsW
MDKLTKYFLVDLFLIILVGIVMVYSSSYIYAKEVMGSSVHFLIKQVSFLGIGVLFAFILSKTKFQFWIKNVYWIHVLATILLALTFSPMGTSIKGSSRWLNIVGFTVQPGEFIKYTILLTSISFFNNFKSYTVDERWKKLGIMVAPLLLLIAQPDFGTFSISVALIMFSCFMSDFPRKYFYSLIGLSAIGVVAILFAAPYRVKRMLTFLDPWSDPQNSGFQIIQSYLAFANGHLFGEGIGNSNEKLFYLPEAYNDFIFSVLGEELGFIGVLFVVLLFTLFVYFGFKIALEMTSKVNGNFIATVIFALGFQAFLNMGVVLGLLPTKGLNLPFISYGGSSLIANLMAIGLIFSAKSPKSSVQDDKEQQAKNLHNYFNQNMNTNHRFDSF